MRRQNHYNPAHAAALARAFDAVAATARFYRK
jgi:hypothetical protein